MMLCYEDMSVVSASDNTCHVFSIGLGLKVKQPCRPSSDTVCGTLEGFYCLDPTKDGCRAAQRHSSYVNPWDFRNETRISLSVDHNYPIPQLEAECVLVASMTVLMILAGAVSLLILIPIILVLESIGSCIACGRAEYRIGDECCPMCSPGKEPLFTSYESPDVNTSSTPTEKHDIVILCSAGNHVHKHCTEFTSTICVPCVDSTFLDEPNGLIKCKVKQPCRPSSDTVCGTLEGFYCLDPTKDGNETRISLVGFRVWTTTIPFHS
ncbi:unnamed protein product [Coregonus sp. 'balchen']|nr:unnamed protein product [Coregonus sp. 'balchen']